MFICDWKGKEGLNNLLITLKNEIIEAKLVNLSFIECYKLILVVDFVVDFADFVVED